MSSTLFIDNITNKSDNTLTVMSNGSLQHQNKSTITETITIPSGSNGLMAGPVTIPTLVVNGSLNVLGDLTVTNDLTINGSKVIVSENLEVGGSCTVSSSSTLKVVGSINVASTFNVAGTLINNTE